MRQRGERTRVDVANRPILLRQYIIIILILIVALLLLLEQRDDDNPRSIIIIIAVVVYIRLFAFLARCGSSFGNYEMGLVLGCARPRIFLE